MELSNRTAIAFLSLALISISIVMPSIIFFKHSGIVQPEDSFAAASITLSVGEFCGDNTCNNGETCSTCEADCGACSVGGAGGGGDGGIKSKIFLLNFTLNDEYIIKPRKGDTIRTIFDEGVEYDFKVDIYIGVKRMILKYETEKYTINFDEIAYFDLDVDGVDDMSVKLLESGDVKFVALSPVEFLPDEEIFPELTKKEIGLVIPGVGKINLIFILILLSTAILIAILYQQFRLRRIERSSASRLKKLYISYGKKKRTPQEKKKMRSKLQKQLDLLTKAYDSGYISKKSYDKGKRKFANLIKKL